MQTKTRIEQAADAVVRKAKDGTPYPIAIAEVSAAGVNRAQLTQELARRRAARKKAQAVAK